MAREVVWARSQPNQILLEFLSFKAENEATDKASTRGIAEGERV